MTKLEKKDGNIEQCPNCHKKIYCRMTKGSEKYPSKLQWQNENGKAHYKFDFATKETSCNEDEVERSSNQSLFDNVKWSTVPEDEKTEDMRELVMGLKVMRNLAYEDAKDIHPDMPENSNTFGQIVNAGISHLINLAKVKAMKARSK